MRAAGPGQKPPNPTRRCLPDPRSHRDAVLSTPELSGTLLGCWQKVARGGNSPSRGDHRRPARGVTLSRTLQPTMAAGSVVWCPPRHPYGMPGAPKHPSLRRLDVRANTAAGRGENTGGVTLDPARSGQSLVRCDPVRGQIWSGATLPLATSGQVRPCPRPHLVRCDPAPGRVWSHLAGIRSSATLSLVRSGQV